MTCLSLNRLTKEYTGQVMALKDVTLTLEAGAFMAVVGPSGSGKTTLLRLVAGLESVTSGRIEIEGQDVTAQPAHERGVAMVFQNSPLYPHMTVFQNMAFALKMARVSRAEIRHRVQETARGLHLETLLTRKPVTLSAGQRQRVGIGKALVRDARVTLFDEPLSHVDAPLRRELRDMILAWHKTRHRSCVWVTHDQAEAVYMGDRVCVLHEGVTQQVAAPREIFQTPANGFVSEFFMIDMKDETDAARETPRPCPGAPS
ncbi:MAG: ABC transporter ATP-binding protein [Phycisphaerae bacterium]|nr:ABC transporter ATP-binding protein [Phycisphaerae bacterium]